MVIHNISLLDAFAFRNIQWAGRDREEAMNFSIMDFYEKIDDEFQEEDEFQVEMNFIKATKLKCQALLWKFFSLPIPRLKN